MQNRYFALKNGNMKQLSRLNQLLMEGWFTGELLSWGKGTRLIMLVKPPQRDIDDDDFDDEHDDDEFDDKEDMQ